MKYIIEIEDSPMFAANGDMLWRAKDFKSLVFDSDGLAKLQPYYWNLTMSADDANISNKQPEKKITLKTPTRLDNRLKGSAQTKSDSEEYKKAAIEAAKKLANAPVDKHKTDKTNKPEKKEESRKTNLKNSDDLTFSIGDSDSSDYLTFSIVDNDKFLDSIRTLIDTFF